MPIRPDQRELYPKNWREISLRIRERADNCCETCDAPNGAYIVRDKANLENWRLAHEPDFLEGYEPDAIKVVLTVAHLNNDPADCRDENLRALCQLHHLRLDAQYHASNAARTRQRKQTEAAKDAGQEMLL